MTIIIKYCEHILNSFTKVNYNILLGKVPSVFPILLRRASHIVLPTAVLFDCDIIKIERTVNVVKSPNFDQSVL